jgi:hypothetical protein
MVIDHNTGQTTYSRDDMKAVQSAMQEMKDSAGRAGNGQALDNISELAALLHIKLRPANCA